MTTKELLEEIGGGWEIEPGAFAEKFDFAEEVWSGGSWDFLPEAAVFDIPMTEDELAELGRAYELAEDEEEITWFEQAALEHGWCPYVGQIDELEEELMYRECMALADAR